VISPGAPSGTSGPTLPPPVQARREAMLDPDTPGQRSRSIRKRKFHAPHGAWSRRAKCVGAVTEPEGRGGRCTEGGLARGRRLRLGRECMPDRARPWPDSNQRLHRVGFGRQGSTSSPLQPRLGSNHTTPTKSTAQPHSALATSALTRSAPSKPTTYRPARTARPDQPRRRLSPARLPACASNRVGIFYE